MWVLGPGLAEQVQHALDDDRILFTGGTLARTQDGGDQLPGESFEEEQRQVAMIAVVVVVERQFLLPVCRILRVIHIQHDHGRRLGVAGDEGVDEAFGQAVNVFARYAVLEPGERGAGGQVISLAQRGTTDRQFEQRIAPQRVGVITVGVAAGGLEYPLTKQVGQRMVNVRGVAFVVNRADQAGNQADLQVDATQQECAKVGGHRPAVKLCPDRKSGAGGKAKLGWDRIVHGRSRLGF